MKRKPIFEADDGTKFETAAECKRYEEIEELATLLGNLHPGDVREALRRNHTELGLADAFERAGSIIAAKRRASGELKRAKKQDGTKSTMEAIASDIKKGVFPQKSPQ